MFLWILILFPQVCLYSYVFNYFSFPWGFNCRLYLQKGAIVIKSLLMTIIWYWFSVLIPDFFFSFLIFSSTYKYTIASQWLSVGGDFKWIPGPWFLIYLGILIFASLISLTVSGYYIMLMNSKDFRGLEEPSDQLLSRGSSLLKVIFPSPIPLFQCRDVPKQRRKMQG